MEKRKVGNWGWGLGGGLDNGNKDIGRGSAGRPTWGDKIERPACPWRGAGSWRRAKDRPIGARSGKQNEMKRLWPADRNWASLAVFGLTSCLP